jgi:lysophospholipase L1-like esterase
MGLTCKPAGMSRVLLFVFALFAARLSADRMEPRVLFLGDSITYGGTWTVYVESAIRAQKGMEHATIVNMGLSSETASGLSEPGHAGGGFPRPDVHERLGRVLDQFKPTIVIACYGINDGIYLPLNSTRKLAYQDGIIRFRLACAKAGAQLVLLTPPLYAPDNRAKDEINYDGVMESYGAWLVEQRAAGWMIIDIHAKLHQAVIAAKRADPNFIYAKDNLHPGEQGHQFMAQAAWEGLAPLMNWKLDTPFAAGEKLKLLKQNSVMLRDAWLRQTGHKRPGVAGGLPLAEAESRSGELIREYLKK